MKKSLSVYYAVLLTMIFIFITTTHAFEEKIDYKTKSSLIGFRDNQIIPIKNPYSNLIIEDFNNDKKLDFLLIDKQAEEIYVYYSVEDKYEEERYFGEGWITDVDVIDINNDKFVDILFSNNNKKLFYLKNLGNKKFSERNEIENISGSFIEVIDIDKDNKKEFTVLGSEFLYIFNFDANSMPENIRKYQNVSNSLNTVEWVDINSDGKLDVVLQKINQTEKKMVCRFQLKDGTLSSEEIFSFNKAEDNYFADIDMDNIIELITFNDTYNSVKVYEYKSAAEVKKSNYKPDLLNLSRNKIFPLSNTVTGFKLGDVNNDGKKDIVILDSYKAEMSIHYQLSDGNFGERNNYPTYTGGMSIDVADISKRHQGNEIIVLSPAEKMIGITYYDNEIISFPQKIDVIETPKTLCCKDFDRDGKLEIIYASVNDYSASQPLIYVVILKEKSDGTYDIYKKFEIKNDEGKEISKIEVFDIDGNDAEDIVIFYHSNLPTFLMNEGKDNLIEPEKLLIPSGLLGDLNAHQFSINPFSKKENQVLIAFKNFARILNVTYKDNKLKMDVSHQYNGKSSASTIFKAFSYDINNDTRSEIILTDTKEKELTIFKKSDKGRWEQVQNLEVAFQGLKDVIIDDINGDKKNDIVLLGQNQFSIYYKDIFMPEYDLSTVYTTTIKDGKYSGMEFGKFSSQKTNDIVVVEGKNFHIEMLTWNEEKKNLNQELTFLLFIGNPEPFSKQYFNSKSKTEERQPSEILVRDFDKDGKDDIIYLTKDSIVVNYQ